MRSLWLILVFGTLATAFAAADDVVRGRGEFFDQLDRDVAAFAAADAAVRGRAIVEKAIEAHGGADELAKLRSMRIKFEKPKLGDAEKGGDTVVREEWRQFPDQYKRIAHHGFVGQKTNVHTTIIDGENGWWGLDGKLEEMSKDAVASHQMEIDLLSLERLGFLNDKNVTVAALGKSNVGGRLGFLNDENVEVAALGELNVGGRAVVGVHVTTHWFVHVVPSGMREWPPLRSERPALVHPVDVWPSGMQEWQWNVKLYFDAESYLLAQLEHTDSVAVIKADRALDEGRPIIPGGDRETRDVVKRVEFGKYWKKDGLQHYGTRTHYEDGKKVSEWKVTEVEFFPSLEKTVFQRP